MGRECQNECIGTWVVHDVCVSSVTHRKQEAESGQGKVGLEKCQEEKGLVQAMQRKDDGEEKSDADSISIQKGYGTYLPDRSGALGLERDLKATLKGQRRLVE